MIGFLLGLIDWSGYVLTGLLLIGALFAAVHIPKIGVHIAIILCMVAGGTYLLRDAYSRGVMDTDRKWEAAAATENQRRQQEIEDNQRKAAEDVIVLESVKNENDILRRQIALAARDGGGRACLSRDVIERLQQFRQAVPRR